MIQVFKLFSYNQNFVPWGLSALVPLKLLEQFFPDFAWGLLSKGYWQFVQMVLHHWTRWLSCPNMVKTLKSLFFHELTKIWGWLLVHSISDSRSTKFVQMMIVGWALAFLGNVKFAPPYICMGENVEQSFSQNVLKTNGWNLQCMVEVFKLLNYNQNFVLWGLAALAPGLYTCLKL